MSAFGMRIGGVPQARIAVALAALLAQPAIARGQAAAPAERDEAPASQGENLQRLSIAQLGAIKVTSVSRSAQPLNDAPAAIYVITHDEIIRSGVQTIPEMLRLAPNLEVAQINATSYAISARGFNVGDNASLSNKLLVMINGRSVYSPMFGGVYWDMLNVSPEDIERIEVISGPGGTLWGSNAVNGVINIITRSSGETQGGLLTVGAGTYGRDVALQYGGRLGPDLTYRLYGAFEDFSAYPLTGGQGAGDQGAGNQGAGDEWSRPSGGFRLDWTPANNTVSLQGGLLAATEEPGGFVRGSDIATNWQHQFADGSSLRLLAYYENTSRSTKNGSGFTVNTYDVEIQHNLTVAGWNDIVWGLGERTFGYAFENTALALLPPRQTLNLADGFLQDTISLSRRVKLTLGTKIEDEPYAGVRAMPSIRLAWRANDSALLWAAVSRALRSPTPADANLHEYAGAVDFLAGSTDFQPEKLTAYEVGTRVQVSPRASFSASAYYDAYDDLRSIDPGAPPSTLPLRFGNLMTGDVYGIELWGKLQVTGWWRLGAGLNALHEDLRFLPGSLTSVGLAFTANDPPHQASLHSAVSLGGGVSWDAYLREVGRLPHPAVPGYTELDTRIGWNVTRSLQLALSGLNLLHREHREFLEEGQSTEVPRSVFAQMIVRF